MPCNNARHLKNADEHFTLTSCLCLGAEAELGRHYVQSCIPSNAKWQLCKPDTLTLGQLAGRRRVRGLFETGQSCEGWTPSMLNDTIWKSLAAAVD